MFAGMIFLSVSRWLRMLTFTEEFESSFRI